MAWKRTIQVIFSLLIVQQAIEFCFRKDALQNAPPSASSRNDAPVVTPPPVASTTASSHPPSSKKCLEVRGNSGVWVQDWDYARRTQYPVRGTFSDWHVAAHKFRPSAKQPYRWATSWKWQDDSGCPVYEISIEGFCQACYRLNLTRILIVGDSMSAEFGISLLLLLQKSVVEWREVDRSLHKSFHIHCKGGSKYAEFTILLRLYRRTGLADWQTVNQQDHEFRMFVEDNDDRTAIVANTGAWIYSLTDYQAAFDAILSWIDSFPDPSRILAFYRPTIPGHVSCQPGPNNPNKTAVLHFDWSRNGMCEAPYRNYSEYEQTTKMLLQNETASSFNWLDFVRYNTYSERTIKRRSPKHAQIHWINIFPSSVLRKDGHVGFQDCLHYYIHGPIDWWVHFFYSMMVDLASTS